MSSKMFLYWGPGSIPCWKAMIALEEKGFHGYPNKECSFSKKEHKGEDIMKLNPRGQLPTFKDGDLVINESGAICEYLERRYPKNGTKLIPDDASAMGQAFQRMYEVQNIDKAVMQNIVYYKYMTKPENIDQDLLKERFEAARTEIGIWESYLKKQGGSGFIAGKDFTMADVQFFPYVDFASQGGLNLSKFPNIKAYCERVMDRPAIKATRAPHCKALESVPKFLEDI